MISTIKMIVLLVVMIYVSEAQTRESGSNCLCDETKNRLVPKSGVKDIQIYPATIFCDKVEIIVSMNSGRRFCLNPNAVTKLLGSVVRKQSTSTTVRPTKLMSSPVSL